MTHNLKRSLLFILAFAGQAWGIGDEISDTPQKKRFKLSTCTNLCRKVLISNAKEWKLESEKAKTPPRVSPNFPQKKKRPLKSNQIRMLNIRICTTIDMILRDIVPLIILATRATQSTTFKKGTAYDSVVKDLLGSLTTGMLELEKHVDDIDALRIYKGITNYDGAIKTLNDYAQAKPIHDLDHLPQKQEQKPYIPIDRDTQLKALMEAAAIKKN